MATLILVGITCLISYLAWQNPKYYNLGLHYPYREKNYKEHWRSLTGGFLHGSGTHLAVNMYMLYMFGGRVEQYFVQEKGEMGRILFVVMYISTIIAANIITGLQKNNDPGYRSVGASGATSGILFIYILRNPWEMFIFPPLPAIILAFAFLFYSTWASRNSNDNIDHMAHYYGAIYGVLFTLILFPTSLGQFIDRLLHDFPL